VKYKLYLTGLVLWSKSGLSQQPLGLLHRFYRLDAHSDLLQIRLTWVSNTEPLEIAVQQVSK